MGGVFAPLLWIFSLSVLAHVRFAKDLGGGCSARHISIATLAHERWSTILLRTRYVVLEIVPAAFGQPALVLTMADLGRGVGPWVSLAARPLLSSTFIFLFVLVRRSLRSI